MAFKYAAGYYPNFFTREDVLKDIETMKQCGINCIRTAELFNGWDQVEPIRGEYYFETLDWFFDMCAQNDIKILLGTGTASPPHWLKEIDPEIMIKSSEGKTFPTNVTYSWACFHNPVYLSESERYIRKLVERYKKHPALYAYQIHNEIGLPFMSPSGKVEMYCYCEHTLKAFREWLKDKYNSIENLNKAWTWSATNPVYTSWEQVEPPYAKPISWASVTRYLDFRLFMMSTITEFVGWQNQIIKSIDNEHLTSTNIFYMKGEDKMSVMCAIDQFEIAKKVDVIGYDLYPGSSNKLETRPEFSSMFLDHARSISRPLGKPYWLMEVESGPINGWALGPHRNTSGTDIKRYIIDAVAHDAKMTLYQGFRQWDFQPINWGGLVDLDGNKTERTEAAEWAGRFCHQHSEVINNSSNGQGQIALLVSSENAIIANGMGHEEFLVKDLRAYYRIFWEMGFQIDFITPELVIDGKTENYSIIAAPFLLSVSENLANALARYTEKGGIFIGETRLGYVDEKGWYNHQWPTGKLQDIFGIRSISVNSGITPELTFDQKNYKGHWHKEKLSVQSGKVLARFFDDTPAVIVNTYGNGKALYFATHAFFAYLELKSFLVWDVLKKLLSEENIEPELQVNYSNRENREIEGHFLHNSKTSLLLFTVFRCQGRSNFFGKKGKHTDIRFVKNRRIERIVDLHTKNDIDFWQDRKYAGFEWNFYPDAFPAFEVIYQ
ncbi:Beta-galactosidase BgaB [Eubacterium callanderi]|uniref:beta-galactosidase n=1 Tax=Eubacterium callanderi TaxID=53442 RepID=UPI0029FF34C5|nr:beta-galactosidase [Eubacterium callanderi]WPK69234.1 Beta-galactosidase BgaB [Eubacterium callanderi]WPK73532.1 Beta-galactosidase BgaB [Eubacterium callanderi]